MQVVENYIYYFYDNVMSQAVVFNRFFSKNSGSPGFAAMSLFHVSPLPPYLGFRLRGGRTAYTCQFSLQPTMMVETSENNVPVLNRYSSYNYYRYLVAYSMKKTPFSI